MTKAVCSGSFDPVTNGHIDIFERAAKMFDQVIVGVFHNIRKEAFFSDEERVRLIQEATAHIPNLTVSSFSGLLPDYLHQVGATVVVRGLRSVTDYEYEITQAQTLKHIAPDIDTVFMLTRQDYAFVSSSCIREIFTFGGQYGDLVPECVAQALVKRRQEMSL